ncbi:hypothetical protein GWK47_022079 [Chionoecetes opilio]|uniref:Uncharacterized protein n=1 Tax=Chionoecetes opilio TaxID=41210 RepID=A0A8J4XNW5_CHIOP|nr:hypothetical protein GWK47_022079 [Chionoecetes opilio]
MKGNWGINLAPNLPEGEIREPHSASLDAKNHPPDLLHSISPPRPSRRTLPQVHKCPCWPAGSCHVDEGGAGPHGPPKSASLSGTTSSPACSPPPAVPCSWCSPSGAHRADHSPVFHLHHHGGR